MAGILRHNGNGDDDGNVVAGFLGQHVAAVEFPEIGVAGALDGALHGSGAGVVRGHGEIPVAELIVEILEVMSGGAGGFFGILTVVNPPAAFESVTLGAAAHELPHATSAGAGNGQGMESGFGLRQVDEVLGHSLFFERPANHIFVAAGAGQGTLDGAASAGGEVIDEAGDLVGHHQREIGVRTLDLGFGFGFDVLIDRRSQFVRFVDRRWFGLLFREAVALLQGGEFEAVDAIEKAVELALEAVVGGEIESAAEQLVESGVKTLLRGFEVPGVIVVQSCLVFLFDTSDQIGHGISGGYDRLGLRWGLGGDRHGGLLRLRFRRAAGCHQGGRLRLGRWCEGTFLGALASDGRRQCRGEKYREIRVRSKPHIFKRLSALGYSRQRPALMRWYYPKIRWVNAT